MDLTKRVGMNIRTIRKSQNMTIDALAEKCDFQSPYLSDVERGERNITLQTLNRILDALQVEPGSVLIPDSSKTTEERENIKEELLKILFNTLEDKDEGDIRMLLNISNEIFGRFNKN
ncbi:helix-turn-helix transcriptional regulator [Lysinibacillus sp. Y5S-8]|uniref:helix-turn-helix domain-containing protein n=1 Tax=Lysinibacillus sp. Y5S-8 TaxID=3122488 RepID=UPI0030CFE233